MSQPHPFPKLGPMATAKHAPAAPWTARRLAVFLLTYAGGFAVGFWLACWVSSLW